MGVYDRQPGLLSFFLVIIIDYGPCHFPLASAQEPPQGFRRHSCSKRFDDAAYEGHQNGIFSSGPEPDSRSGINLLFSYPTSGGESLEVSIRGRRRYPPKIHDLEVLREKVPGGYDLSAIAEACAVLPPLSLRTA